MYNMTEKKMPPQKGAHCFHSHHVPFLATSFTLLLPVIPPTWPLSSRITTTSSTSTLPVHRRPYRRHPPTSLPTCATAPRPRCAQLRKPPTPRTTSYFMTLSRHPKLPRTFFSTSLSSRAQPLTHFSHLVCRTFRTSSLVSPYRSRMLSSPPHRIFPCLSPISMPFSL